jgi:hypothetical protein
MSSLQDLVVRGTGVGIPRSVAPGDAALAHGSSSTVGLGISRLYLPGSLGSPPPPINWRRVGDEAESACSQVTAMETLLHEMVASVHQNIQRPIQISLKREAKSCPHSNGFLHALSFFLCSIFVALVLR